MPAFCVSLETEEPCAHRPAKGTGEAGEHSIVQPAPQTWLGEGCSSVDSWLSCQGCGLCGRLIEEKVLLSWALRRHLCSVTQCVFSRNCSQAGFWEPPLNSNLWTFDSFLPDGRHRLQTNSMWSEVMDHSLPNKIGFLNGSIHWNIVGYSAGDAGFLSL